MAFAKQNGWTGAVVAGCGKKQETFQFSKPPVRRSPGELTYVEQLHENLYEHGRNAV